MEFRILGPLQATAGLADATLARRERILLALLLLHTNQPVSVERISEAIWGQRQPRNATGQVHGTVYRLRKQLTMAGIPEAAILTDPAGYRTQIDPQTLDLIRFRQLRDRARTTAAGGEPEQAAAQYRAGLELLRGSALAGIDSDLLRQAAATLDEEHLQAWQECLETELSMGHAGELVAELTDLVGQHPHREGLHRLLMLALYRADRQADALAAYRHARQLLRDDLGIEPGAELQRLHQAILNRDPDLNTDRSQPKPAPTATAASPIPRELPADVAGFTGRAEALKALDEMLATVSHEPPAPVVISAIAGTAGVGKTALAVHWAHRVADRFPDGQLYINVRGYASSAPLRSLDALSTFLRSLGIPPEQIPTDEDQASALYRTKLASRRMLIVLDNARSVDQVRPLLPGNPGCLVLVTSRDRLSGLVARDGAARVTLDVFTPEEAQSLLATLLGKERVAADAGAVADLAEACAYLPLALRIGAELAASRPAASLADLAAELSDRQRRLELLDSDGDPLATVRVVFSWSIQHLPSEVARTFRLLGLHPGPDFEAYAVAALADSSLDQARHALEQLAQAHLIHPTEPGRFGMHDLLRAYASQRSTTEEPSTCHIAMGRLFDYYLAAASTAMNSLYPAEVDRRPWIPTPATPTPRLTEQDLARTWLDNERAALVASAAHTATHGPVDYAIKLSTTLHRYLDGGHYLDAIAIHSYAFTDACKTNDLVGQARALRHLGTIHHRLDQYELAETHLHRAMDLFLQTDDRTGTALALTNLGTVDWKQGRYYSAIDYHQHALGVFREAGDQHGEALALNNVGVVETWLGHNNAAIDCHRQALAVFRQLKDRSGEASALTCLGIVEERLGHYESATGRYTEALILFRDLGNRQGEANITINLGSVLMSLGQLESATEYFKQALTRFRELGDHRNEAHALASLGQVTVAAGHSANDALAHFTDALSVAINTKARDLQAEAYAGLGRAHLALGSQNDARSHYERALAIYTDLGLPDAEDIRARLIALTPIRDRTRPNRVHTPQTPASAHPTGVSKLEQDSAAPREI